jgi:ParB-like chromosome segregation protein Spo0J
MRNVKLNDIRIDGGTQCRVVLNQTKIYEYVERMKEGDEFPLIEARFDGSTYWLSDGFHRYHAFKLLGIKEITINYKPGTQDDAFLDALKANGKHGLALTIEDKVNKVKMALKHDRTKDKTNYELAKICELSQSFVAGVRDPEKKKKQKENKERHIQKKAQEIASQTSSDTENTSLTSSVETTHRESPNPNSGVGPDEQELKATELAMQADVDTMYKLLESDDALATAHAEIKRLNHLNAQLEVRLHGLMNERNECVKMVKKLQRELDKLKGKK